MTATRYIECKDHTTEYVPKLATQAAKTCPLCRTKRTTTRDQDEADILSTYLGRDRLLTKALISSIDRHNTNRAPHAHITPLEYIRSMQTQANVPLPSTTPLHVACTHCGSSYTLFRTQPTTQQTPPLYCVYCAAQITAQQQSTDDVCWLVLSQAYQIPVNVVQALYNIWSKSSHFTYFADYMQSKEVSALLPAMQQL